MKEKNKNESLYRIKVNKKLIHKNSENNIKTIKTPFKINNNNINESNILIKKNSLSKLIKNLYNFDFDINEKYKNNKIYSQRTYTCKYLIDESPYKKGNIIYDMQKNKYLKPIFDSKDFQKKMLKCKIDEPFSRLLQFNKDFKCKSLSELSSPKNNDNKENNNIYNLKKENKDNNNTLYLSNHLKEFNLNFPLTFLKNRLNNSKNYSCRNKNKDILQKYHSFNKLKSNILFNGKASNRCKKFQKKTFNYKSEKNFFKFHKNKKSNSFKERKINKSLKERIGDFCYILEIFFLNIIKKHFEKLINKIKSIRSSIRSEDKYYYKINSEANSKRNTFYDTDTIRSYKNYNFDNEITKNNHISNLNYFNKYDTDNNIINNLNNFDRDIIEEPKDINYYINNIKKINKNHTYNNINDKICNKKFPKTKKKILLFRKINNKCPSDRLLIYQKKNNFTKNNYSIKNEKNKMTKINKSENIENTCCDSIGKNKTKLIKFKNNRNYKLNTNINKNKKLFLFFNYYSIRDINYKKAYNKKYINNLKSGSYNRPLYFYRNIYFSIKQKINVYKKIKINGNSYKKNNFLTLTIKKKNNKSKKIYNMNFPNSINKDIKNNTNNNNKKINFNKKNIEIKENNLERNEKINKILVNCAKLLSKILTKIYLKKKFYTFKKNIDFI